MHVILVVMCLTECHILLQGTKGLTGEDGEDGAPGAPGQPGSQGDIGNSGPRGDPVKKPTSYIHS